MVASDKEGALTPKANSPCSCHYAGWTIDGTEFDSSIKRGTPTTFAPNQVIKGWTEAMQLMKEGDKWELTIPSEIAYGDSQRGPHITPGKLFFFFFTGFVDDTIVISRTEAMQLMKKWQVDHSF